MKNRNRTLALFWQHILNCKGRYSNSKDDRIDAYRSIYKKKTYSEGEMRSLILKTRNLIETFTFNQEGESTALGQTPLVEYKGKKRPLTYGKHFKEVNKSRRAGLYEGMKVLYNGVPWGIIGNEIKFTKK